jgi:hypothetical protein
MHFLCTVSFGFWQDSLPGLLKAFHVVVIFIDFRFNEAGLSRFVRDCSCLFHEALSTRGLDDACIWTFRLWRRHLPVFRG